MHLGLGADIFDSFQDYQSRLIDEYNLMAQEFGFVTVDARRSIDEIQRELRGHIARYLKNAARRTPARRSGASAAPFSSEPEE